MGTAAVYRRIAYVHLSQPWQFITRRPFSCTAPYRSGHNRWSKIKHDKGSNDAKKSKSRSILSRDVILASQLGGPDPALNARLLAAITNAKRGALSKASIESAIARGQGKSTNGAPLESLTIEAMLPFSVGAVIECQTDQKTRAFHDIRAIIARRGGSITPTSFLFERKGKVIFEKKEGVSSDQMLDHAIEAGATDVDMDATGKLVVETEPSQLFSVMKQLTGSLGLEVLSSDIIHDPKEDTMVSLDDENLAAVESLVGLIEEDPSVQDVFINAA